jgi:hypothetical protein
MRVVLVRSLKHRTPRVPPMLWQKHFPQLLLSFAKSAWMSKNVFSFGIAWVEKYADT